MTSPLPGRFYLIPYYSFIFQFVVEQEINSGVDGLSQPSAWEYGWHERPHREAVTSETQANWFHLQVQSQRTDSLDIARRCLRNDRDEYIEALVSSDQLL
jgi:hypothetical protein